jgi:hypothetical protein
MLSHLVEDTTMHIVRLIGAPPFAPQRLCHDHSGRDPWTPSKFLVTNWMVMVLTLCRPEEARFRSLHCVRVSIGPPRSWIFAEIEVR